MCTEGRKASTRAYIRENHVNSRDLFHRIRFCIYRNAVPVHQAVALVSCVHFILALDLSPAVHSDQFLRG